MPFTTNRVFSPARSTQAEPKAMALSAASKKTTLNAFLNDGLAEVFKLVIGFIAPGERRSLANSNSYLRNQFTFTMRVPNDSNPDVLKHTRSLVLSTFRQNRTVNFNNFISFLYFLRNELSDNDHNSNCRDITLEDFQKNPSLIDPLITCLENPGGLGKECLEALASDAHPDFFSDHFYGGVGSFIESTSCLVLVFGIVDTMIGIATNKDLASGPIITATCITILVLISKYKKYNKGMQDKFVEENSEKLPVVRLKKIQEKVTKQNGSDKPDLPTLPPSSKINYSPT